eukprot:7219154-Prymnesium_polylepis.1
MSSTVSPRWYVRPPITNTGVSRSAASRKSVSTSSKPTAARCVYTTSWKRLRASKTLRTSAALFDGKHSTG